MKVLYTMWMRRAFLPFSALLLPVHLLFADGIFSFPPIPIAMAVIRFSDADVQVGDSRGELTLVGRVCGSRPALHALKADLLRLWNCSAAISIVPLNWDLIQVVFSTAKDLNRVRKNSPWFKPKYVLHLIPWETPSPSLVDSLLRVPLMVQLWGIPYTCCTERLGTLMGASLGAADPTTIHQSEITGGLYVRVKVWIDDSAPLPYEVPALHDEAGKGEFTAAVKFERLPQFFYLCGVVGHTGVRCLRKEELGGTPMRNGTHTISLDKGPCVDERTLDRKRKFTWIRKADKSETKASLWGPLSSRSGAIVVHNKLQQLSIEAGEINEAAPSLAPAAKSPKGGAVPDPIEPIAKRPRISQQGSFIDAEISSRVEATDPDQSQSIK
ncbi:unnamed protein product [Linum trigynum]|uniref:DUF4283 domain-containing protein n=1 Tax=Linum trigynum TaxID=586398 RepID=A0AAV2EET3_9ROSI